MTTPAPSTSAPSAAPRVGQSAPDFTLVDQHGVDVSLSSVRGRKLAAVVFYPFAFSGICTGELREIRDRLEDFQDGDIQVFTISCDSMYSLRAWADIEGHFFPLLSDHWPHGEVTRRYGVFNEEQGAPLRATFLLDREGRVAWREINGPGEGRDFVAYRAALAELRGASA
ncbi:peroxiredoxin [Intrasporangium sp. DVR]|uniref:peroxiredoxin n=1 Tax=Intrasporangium sp. DVR TaxID=3127867 RepID=UPI00313A69AF